MKRKQILVIGVGMIAFLAGGGVVLDKEGRGTVQEHPGSQRNSG